jgi:general secretion pathway protein G
MPMNELKTPPGTLLNPFGLSEVEAPLRAERECFAFGSAGSFDFAQGERKSAYRRSEHGFTLVELLVVIVIIGLLATIVAINVIPAGSQARVEKAKADIAILEQALEQYRLDNLTYPASTDGLNALLTPPAGLAQPERYRQGGYIKKLPDDPWGKPYHYEAPGKKGAFDIFSLGADGQSGGNGDNADIYSSDI